MKGSYVLLLKLPEARNINTGRLPDVHFASGCYAYVGSALNGLKSRLSRHLRQSKKSRWHIDYLLRKASITAIIFAEAEERIECDIAQALSSQFSSVPGFGSSDCRCSSHLFFAPGEAQMRASVMSAFKRLALSPGLIEPENYHR